MGKRLFTTVNVLVCLIVVLGTFSGVALGATFDPATVKITASSEAQLSTAPENVIEEDGGKRWSTDYKDGDEAWIQLAFPQEIEFREFSVMWYGKNNRAGKVRVMISSDGEKWTTIRDSDLEVSETDHEFKEKFTFPKTKGKYFRLELSEPVGFTFSIVSLTFPGVEFREPTEDIELIYDPWELVGS